MASSMENACRVSIEPSARTSILIDSVKANDEEEKEDFVSISEYTFLNDIQVVRDRRNVYKFSS